MKNLKLILKYLGLALLVVSLAVACKKKSESSPEEDVEVETIVVEEKVEGDDDTTNESSGSSSTHQSSTDQSNEGQSVATEKAAEAATEEVDAVDVDNDVQEVEVVEFVTFFNVEQVPVYPGCEDAADQKACFNKKISAFVSHNFDEDVAKEIGQTDTSDSKLVVNFIIDKNGNVTQVKAVGPNDAMTKEAERVVKRLPQFKPGTVNDVPVNVQYALPIDYKVK